MTLNQIGSAGREAIRLILASPFTWLAAILVFLILSEAMMFIPYVGFIMKLLVGSLLAAGIVGMFWQASAGTRPSVRSVFGGLKLPTAHKATLFACALLPFAAGTAYLYMRAGQSGIAYFFGNILRDERPSAELFMAFKMVMYVVATPLAFVAATVVVKRLAGWSAVRTAVGAALSHWQAPLTIFAMNIAFERVVVSVAQALPKATAGLVAGCLLVIYLAWSFGFTFALAVRALSLDRRGSGAAS